MLSAPKLQKRIRFAINTQTLALLFIGVFLGSLTTNFIAPLTPKAHAATGANFSVYVGEDGAYQRAIADAYNAGGGDQYDNGGWKNIKIFAKNLAGIGNVTLNYNEDTSKKIACMGNGPLGPDQCESREPIFTKTYFCTLPDTRTTASRPTSDATEYYEITYAVMLAGNKQNGDDFVKQPDFKGIGGVTKVKKFEKPNDSATYTREVVTRDLIRGSTSADELDDARNGGQNGRDDDDWGIDSQDAGCRPRSTPPADLIGNMTMKNFGKLTEQQRADFNPPAADTDGSTGGGGKDPEVDPCDDIGKLGWIVCPVVNATTEAIEELDTAINNLLTVETKPIFDNTDEESTGAAYYKSWNAFRIIALGIMVIAALVVIIATAFGYELLDAYTIRKVLPRFLIAIIFITLSWSILEFLVTLTNDVGNGIRAIIYQPFTDAMGQDIDFSGGTAMLINILLGTSFIALGALGLLSFALTALLAMLVAFLVLVIRELIIIFLVLVAPLAIACLILPNTRKAWQLWQNTLTGMLLIFPIIAAMIATGRVFALTTSQGGDDLLTDLLAFSAYLLPYFLLPFAFRAAGGLMATLAGLANDRSRGAFDRLKNYRGKQMADMHNKNKSFSRFSGKTPVGRGLNTAIGAATNPKSMLRGRGGVAAARSSRQKAYGANYLKDNEIFQANQGDDAFLLAVANRGLAETKMNKALGDSTDMSLSADKRAAAQKEAANYRHAIDAAAQMGYRGQTAAVRSQAFSALAKTGYQIDQGQAGYDQLHDTARSIAGNNDGAYSSLMNEAQYGLRTAGRYDLGGINHGSGFDGKSGTDKGSLYELANGKKESITQLARNAGTTGAANTEAHAVAYQELKAMLPNSKGGNRDEILKQMSDLEFRGVKAYMNTPTGTMKNQRVSFDNTNTAHTAGPNAFSPEERVRGWRVERVAETNADRADKKARTYERPDPNNL